MNAIILDNDDDIKLLENITINKVVIMGRKTMERIGKPLPNRLNIVLTRNLTLNRRGYIILYSIQDLMNFLKINRISIGDCFIIGKELICEGLKRHITYVYANKNLIPIPRTGLQKIYSSRIYVENRIIRFNVYRNCELVLNFVEKVKGRPLSLYESQMIKNIFCKDNKNIKRG